MSVALKLALLGALQLVVPGCDGLRMTPGATRMVQLDEMRRLDAERAAASSGEGDSPATALPEKCNTGECPICLDKQVCEHARLPCGHACCLDCTIHVSPFTIDSNSYANLGGPMSRCPLCRDPRAATKVAELRAEYGPKDAAPGSRSATAWGAAYPIVGDPAGRWGPSATRDSYDMPSGAQESRRRMHILNQRRAAEEVNMLSRVTNRLERADRRMITPHLLFTEFFDAYRLAENYATAVEQEFSLEERRRFTESGSRTAALEESDVDVLNQWLHADHFGGYIEERFFDVDVLNQWLHADHFDSSWVIEPQMRWILRRGLARALSAQEWGYFCALSLAVFMADGSKQRALHARGKRLNGTASPRDENWIDTLQKWTDALSQLAKGVQLAPMIGVPEFIGLDLRSSYPIARMQSIRMRKAGIFSSNDVTDLILTDDEKALLKDIRAQRDYVLSMGADLYDTTRRGAVPTFKWTFDREYQRNDKVKIVHSGPNWDTYMVRFFARRNERSPEWRPVKEHNYDVLMNTVRDCNLLLDNLWEEFSTPNTRTQRAGRGLLRQAASRFTSRSRSRSPAGNQTYVI